MALETFVSGFRRSERRQSMQVLECWWLKHKRVLIWVFASQHQRLCVRDALGEHSASSSWLLGISFPYVCLIREWWWAMFLINVSVKAGTGASLLSCVPHTHGLE